MKIRLIGQVLNNESKLVGYICLDMTTNVAHMVGLEELKMSMRQGVECVNAELNQNNDFYATDGSLSRLAIFGVNGALIGENKITILGKHVDTRNNPVGTYLIMSSLGQQMTVSEQDLIKALGKDRGTNAYVKTSNLSGDSFISAISGTMPTIVVADKPKYKPTTNEKSKAPDYLGRTRFKRVEKNLCSFDRGFKVLYGNGSGISPYCTSDIIQRYENEISLIDCITNELPALVLDTRKYLGNVNNGYNSLLNIYMYLRPEYCMHNITMGYYSVKNRLSETKRKFNALNAEYKELKDTTPEQWQERKDSGEYLSNYQFNYMIGRKKLIDYSDTLKMYKKGIEQLTEALNQLDAINIKSYVNTNPKGMEQYARKGKLSFVLYRMQSDDEMRAKFRTVKDISTYLDVLFFYYAVQTIASYLGVDGYPKYERELIKSKYCDVFRSYSKLPQFQKIVEALNFDLYRGRVGTLLYGRLCDDEKKLAELIIPRI